jgi:elongation factor P--beta-lysine ligase
MLKSRSLNSLAEFFQYLNSFDIDFLAGTQLRSQAENRVFQDYYSATEQSLTGLMVIWEKVLEAKIYQHLGLDETTFLAHYNHVQQRVAAHLNTRDKGAEASKTILKC